MATAVTTTGNTATDWEFGYTDFSTLTGTGAVVLGTSPTLTTPNLGTPTSVTLSNATGLPIDGGTTGTLPIGRGGTGQTTAVTAFDALSPTTTKGDLIVSNGTDNVRLPVGTDTYVLTADSAQTNGVKWAAAGGATDVIIFTGLDGGLASTVNFDLILDLKVT